MNFLLTVSKNLKFFIYLDQKNIFKSVLEQLKEFIGSLSIKSDFEEVLIESLNIYKVYFNECGDEVLYHWTLENMDFVDTVMLLLSLEKSEDINLVILM